MQNFNLIRTAQSYNAKCFIYGRGNERLHQVNKESIVLALENSESSLKGMHACVVVI